MLKPTAVAVVLLLASSLNVYAQKTDVVTMANGDRITGEIVNLDRGRLEFKTDDAGTIDFEWMHLAAVESSRQFEVVVSDGQRYLGRLSSAGSQTLVVTNGTDSATLAMHEVTSIIWIGARFWSQLDGSVSAGFNYTRSSGIAQTTFNTDTRYRRPAFLFRVTSAATVTQSNDDEANDRAALDIAYDRFRGRRWFVSAGGRLETNESLGLALRSQAGGMVGWRAVNSNRAQLAYGGGSVVNNETSVDNVTTQHVEGMLVLKSAYYRYDKPSTTLDGSIVYYPSFSQWGRQRLQFDGAVSRELFKDFKVGVNLYDSFDSDPPNTGADRNDFGISISVGWSY